MKKKECTKLIKKGNKTKNRQNERKGKTKEKKQTNHPKEKNIKKGGRKIQRLNCLSMSFRRTKVNHICTPSYFPCTRHHRQGCAC